MVAVPFTIEYHRLFCYPLMNDEPFLSFLYLLFLNLLVVADAYCLLDVYSVLSRNPANFGLPADLRSISSSQAEKSGNQKEKLSQAKQPKQALGREVRGQLTFFNVTDVIDVVYFFVIMLLTPDVHDVTVSLVSTDTARCFRERQLK